MSMGSLEAFSIGNPSVIKANGFPIVSSPFDEILMQFNPIINIL